jgi:hypothetical protein
MRRKETRQRNAPKERAMSHSIKTADARTHVKIVAVSLIAGIVVMIAAIHVRHEPGPEGKIFAGGQPVVRASQARVYSLHADSTLR